MRVISLIAISLALASLSAQGDPIKDFEALELQAAGMQPLEDPSGERPGARGNGTGFSDYSPSGFLAAINEHRQRLRDLAAIDPSTLTKSQQVTYDVIRWDSERMLDREAFPLLQFPYSPYEFVFRGPNRVLSGFDFRGDADANGYLKLVRHYTQAIQSIEQQIDAQQAAHIYIQREVASRIRAQIIAYAKPFRESFAWPNDIRLSRLSAHQRTMLRRALQTLIPQHINLPLRHLSERFGTTYQAMAPERYGLAQYPGGKDYYKVLVKYRLTLDKAPEALFEESQAALDRIESELTQLRAEMGYHGPRQPFDHQLSIDPAFTAKTPADVEKVYLDYMSRMDSRLPALFCRAAPYGYGVKRATPELEAALTFGLADTEVKPMRRGMYYYNGSNLEKRSLLPAQALIYHELAPGHYWQGAMAWVSKSLTAYPRQNNAFAESWGDFAQLLAYEQGVFRTPAEKYGRRLFNAMFHARALADIGINYFGKDFDWGLKVLSRYTFESELQNRASLARDTTDWQAQILPYSFGSQELLRMRERVHFELGEKFSEQRFYDEVLSLGSIAFPVLDKQLDWFIAQERTGGAPGICKN